MKRINLHQLTEAHLPLGVGPYETGEGNDGYAIFTKNNEKVDMENGSYGYDTYFPDEDEATKTANFLNECLTK